MIGLLLASRHPTVQVTGIEIQPELAHYAAQNARANALGQRCRIIRGDLRQAQRFLPPEHFHRVVANPPFRRYGSGATPPDPVRALARQESTFSLTDLAGTAAALLRFGGTLCVIHLAERLPVLFKALDGCGLEPKTLRLVAPFAASAPRLCLLSAVKGGRPGLTVLPLLVLDASGGRDTAAAAPTPGNGPDERAMGDKKHQLGK